jgi:hypothetical protein
MSKRRKTPGYYDVDLFMLYILYKHNQATFYYLDTYIPCDTCTMAMHASQVENPIVPIFQSICVLVPDGVGRQWHIQLQKVQKRRRDVLWSTSAGEIFCKVLRR